MAVRPSVRTSVRPSVRTTGLPCSESCVVLARNRMLTRVVAKQAKTTKFKNKFVKEIKSSKEYKVVFLVEGEKFDLGEKNRR